MKLVDDNKVVMTKQELAGVMLGKPSLTEKAMALVQRKPTKKAKKPAKKATMGRRNLRITDHQMFKLLRVAPAFGDRETTHGKILNAWAMLPDAMASVKRLLGYLGYNAEGKETHHGVINEVENPLAWIRQTIKQAVLRGDAKLVAGETNTEIPSAPKTTESSPAGQENTAITSDDTEQSDAKKFGERFGVGTQSNDLGPLP